MESGATCQIIQTEWMSDSDPSVHCDTLEPSVKSRIAPTLAAWTRHCRFGKLADDLRQITRDENLGVVAVLFHTDEHRLVRVPPPALPFEPIELKRAVARVTPMSDAPNSPRSTMRAERSAFFETSGAVGGILLIATTILLAAVYLGIAEASGPRQLILPAAILAFLLATGVLLLFRRRQTFIIPGGVLVRRGHPFSSRSRVKVWDRDHCMLFATCDENGAIVRLHSSNGRRLRFSVRSGQFNALLAAWQIQSIAAHVETIRDM